ncbi:glycine--tRNA ligase subunit beta [Prochlorococcus sp. MIT 1307]|uniref:glycine--tRNA ligase subunit beta n=1 Tax=Prochlorococcus sp. MIT 1307 TaxID=3096219 RepID=UPI002A751851|nr:glycine--tRNA ligase subunit beta [Prochlorococcus sp. MIT 1307]
MATFLLEVGTEELPADFARLVTPQLEKLVKNDLTQRRLDFQLVKCTSTPRRIVLIAEGVADSARDFESEYKGPPANKAFLNGSPTKAAIGFAKKFDLDPSALEVRETSKGSFVFAKVCESGADAKELLGELIPGWIGNLQGRRFMRWGLGEQRFSRPVRWLVAFLDESLIKVCLKGTDPEVVSGRQSKGHRLHQDDVVISSAKEYQSILSKSGVQIDRDKRQGLIQQLIINASKELNAVVDISIELLEELTDLVESPNLIIGEFDHQFLELPAEVLSTVMRVHQRYIPLYLDLDLVDPLSLNAKNTLFPKFLCISNGLPSANKTIKLGNERVLRARLSDAQFFVQADLAVTSSDRCDQLSNVTFAEGLGSLLDRVKRIEWISNSLCKYLKYLSLDKQIIHRAASLCKHDLVSQMVNEFPELQGIIGAKYLLAEGESRDISLAVLEHYLPRYAGGDLPKSDAGSILALSERIELLLSIFAKGERPTGSSDPYALRRAGNGILLILKEKGWKLNLNELLEYSINYWSALFTELTINPNRILLDISEFLRLRIISILEESGIDFDIAQAVAGQTIDIKRLLSDPVDVFTRANLLTDMRSSGQLLSVQQVVTRASRLAKSSLLDISLLSSTNVVDSKLFEKESEFNMLKIINSLEPIALSDHSDRYVLLAKKLSESTSVLSSFFDGDGSVMVMTDSDDIRINRLNLLRVLCNQASIIADFDQIKMIK